MTMDHLTQLLFPLLLLGLFVTGLRSGVLTTLAARPLLTVGGAVVLGAVYRQFGGPDIEPETIRGLSRFGLAMLVFLAAQQCRVSRLRRVSPAAFRLALFATPLCLAIFSATAFILVPGLELWGTLIVGVALVLGCAPAVEGPLLSAPIDDDTRCAARVEGAAAFSVALPIALIVEAGLMAPNAQMPLHTAPLFYSLAGFTVGGGLGLVLGRVVKLSNAPLPVLPFLVALSAYGAGLFTGFDPVMAAAGAGLLYSEEAKLSGAVRTRLWRTGERWLTPFAFAGFGFIFGPVLVQADFLVWVMGVVAVTLGRIAPRMLVLQGRGLQSQDRNFLAWFGGAPGAASALMLLSLLGSPTAVVQDQPVALAAVTILLGLAFTRLTSQALTQRLVQETALARKRRYSPA